MAGMTQSNTGKSITVIVCACGRSTRFKANKLLHPMPGGKPLLQTTLENIVTGLGESGVSAHCKVVIPPRQKEMQHAVAQTGVSLLVMDPPSGGLGETIAYAVSQTADSAGWLICLADMPMIEPGVYRAILEAAGDRILAPVHQGQRGHPVYFPGRLFSELVALRGDKGAASLLRLPGSALELMPVPGPSVTLDVDTPGDLVRLDADFGALAGQ